MLSCNAILGQFANHPRMHRTIQNKTFEALALEMPYITMDSTSNRELLTDREDCLFVNPADSEDLADKILELKNNTKLQEKIAKNGYKLYKEKLDSKAIGIKFLDILKHS
jgi:glycosyltransferase involved in cell wall biosynthesis